MESDGLPIGPSVLEPGAPTSPDRFARVLLIPLLAVLLLVIVVFYVLFSTSRVNGDSMLPTLQHGDMLLLTKSYQDPQRGDVIVFNIFSGTEFEEALIKRVVAVPGDTVEVRRGVAVVNGVVETTSSLVNDSSISLSDVPTVVPPGHVYVLGDNRTIALDSRELGPIPLSTVTGKASYVFAPVSRIASVR